MEQHRERYGDLVQWHLGRDYWTQNVLELGDGKLGVHLYQFPNYLVTNRAEVYMIGLMGHRGGGVVERSRWRKIMPTMSGGKWVVKVKDRNRNRQRILLDRLVAITFVKPKRDCHVLKHLDGDEDNCLPENLAWVKDPDRKATKITTATISRRPKS